ncbi:MAG TPA: hypothetical protein VKE95_19925 [Burkholderiales bacterium]|nr:hypothetical protein [Burkholderiales bacterium]
MAEERDPKVSRRYRELGAEEPPRELDQTILAAAHRAADHSHAPLVPPVGRHRWYFAFGAAAILVLAVAVTVQVERQPDPEALSSSTASLRIDNFHGQAEKESKAQSEPSKPLADAGAPPARERRKAPAEAAPAASPPAEAKPQAAEVARVDRLEARQQEQARKSREAASATAPSADATRPQKPVPQPAPPAVAPPAPESQARTPEEQAVLGSAAVNGVIASGVALSPDRLLEIIAELRKQGRHEEADKALAEFRKQYPDYKISEEMLRKVERSR